MIAPAPRRVDFRKLEERIQRFWEERGIYEKSRQKLKGGEKYYFLDGPPYASGAIHLGTAWNKIIKDAVLRYLAMRGYNVQRQPGWDCHGLPIEVKVEKEMGIKNKREIEENVEAFIEACRSWALRHVEIMTSQFRRLGVWMDWEEPYMTLRDEYIESAWWTIKRAHEKGLLTRDLRVVTWCPRCETALAEAEIEYRERTDPSIYVKFPIQGAEREYLLIWTTTPWTLVGNLAVAVHPEFEYVKAETKQGRIVIAKELVHLLKEKFGLSYKIVEEFRGRELEGLRYENPLKDYIKVEAPENAYRVILADFVTLGEGTGLVHCAPGHGPEDFEVAKRYGIPALCPVDGEGRFTELAGKYAGYRTKRDDRVIIQDLSKKGLLLKAEHITHRYGHCWRCKTPIIYRATEQWFIAITKLKERMLSEIERVEWIPEWAGSARFRDWISNARDWTISRQRYWGIPIPVWLCDRCGSMEVIASKAELEEKAGKVKELHRPHVDVSFPCECGGEKRRVSDVLDVWFDSGVAAWASLGYPAREEPFRSLYPVDFITEGHDQTRGWFYSQLGCGLLAFDEVPYRRVLMHGFTLDEKGEKMSKSLGNVVTPEEVIERFSADVLRFYVLWANKPWEDLRFNWEEVRVVAKMFNILWNVYVFATTYMSLDRFTPEKLPRNLSEHYRSEDRWILSRLNSVIREVNEGFETLHLYRATRALNEFIVEDLSRWYITLVRPRTWEERESIDKIAAYSALYRVLCNLAKLLAPIAPHVSEEIYQNLVRSLGTGEESVHLERFPSPQEELIDEELERAMLVARGVVEATASAREKLGVKRRWPVLRLIFSPGDEEAAKAAQQLEELIRRQGNALKLEILPPGEEPAEVELVAEPNFAALGPEFKALAGKVAEAIRSADARKLHEGMQRGGYPLTVAGEEVLITEKHVSFSKRLPGHMAKASFEHGVVYIDATKTREILELGFAREVVRRIQEMRKELDLAVEAYISSRVSVADEEIVAYLEAQRDYIARETRSKQLEIATQLDHEGYAKTWKIAGREFRISIKEAG